MGLAREIESISIADYLEGEKRSEIRHEYVDGQVFAMAGASKRHNRIIQNIGFRLQSHLSETDCEMFLESVKLRADEITIYYPDIVVTCEPADDDDYVVYQPILIVEVISPTSERTDRYEKLQVYRRMPGLREYAIVWQEEMRVEIHRRTDAENWAVERFVSPSAIVKLTSIDSEINLTEIYQNIAF